MILFVAPRLRDLKSGTPEFFKALISLVMYQSQVLRQIQIRLAILKSEEQRRRDERAASFPPPELVAALKAIQDKAFELSRKSISNGVTPEEVYKFELELKALKDEESRLITERTANYMEPDDPAEVPKRLERGTEEYSRKEVKTPRRGGVATLFGMINLNRFSYEPLREEREAGLRSIVPLIEELGLVEGCATPALAEVIGHLAQDHSEAEVLEYLERVHRVSLSATTIVKIRDSLANGLHKHLEEEQFKQLTAHLETASRRGGVVISVGRDGIFLPMRGRPEDHWKEGAVATISVYSAIAGDEKPKRIGTVYLGQMPKPGQQELSERLTRLLKRFLSDPKAEGARLVYVTDAGHHPEDYFQTTLKDMEDPLHPGRKLEWARVVDYHHVTTRITTIAKLLFRTKNAQEAWASRMRHILKTETNAVHRILCSAAAHMPCRMGEKARNDFEKAKNYLLNHRDCMDYVTYREKRMPIGSGVTEAACKTIFTQRFKCSGMMWKRDDDYDHTDPDAKVKGARAILTLRLAARSGVYRAVFQSYLAERERYAKTLTRVSIPVRSASNPA